jgi:hypothetical protein
VVLCAICLSDGGREWPFFVVYVVGVWVGRWRGGLLHEYVLALWRSECTCEGVSYSLIILIFCFVLLLLRVWLRMVAICVWCLFRFVRTLLLVFLLLRLGYGAYCRCQPMCLCEPCYHTSRVRAASHAPRKAASSPTTCVYCICHRWRSHCLQLQSDTGLCTKVIS